jgi:hypothetical protein
MIVLTEYIKRDRSVRRAHLDLSESCLERGGNSTNHKGVLAQFLNTDIPSGRILLCHACHNGKCSNPKHLYWGTDRDNLEDAKENGTHKSPWDNLVEKHGYEKACQINSIKMQNNTNGSGNAGKSKSEEHKKNISLNRKGGKPKGWRKNKSSV